MFAVIVILIFLFFLIVSIWTEGEEEKKEEKRKQAEAQREKEYEKRRQKELARQEWQDTLYTLALKIGKKSGINHLHRIILGFGMRETDLTSEEKDLLLVAERAMKELTPDTNYSTPPPQVPQQIHQPFDYKTSWWKRYSEWYRNEKGWTCEECELDFNDDHYYLHTHHVFGTQHNKPQDLKALCLGCHAEKPRHDILKENSNYEKFIAKYGQQWKNNLNTFKTLSIQFGIELAKVSNSLGVSKARLGQYNDAIKGYDAAIRLNPDYAAAYYNRALAMKKIFQAGEARQDFQTALRLARQAGDVDLKAKAEKALRVSDYDQAIQLEPDHVNDAKAYFNHGLAKAKLGQHAAAISDYDRAIQLKPDYANAYNNRGNAKYHLGQYLAAVSDYDKAIQLEPDHVNDAKAYYNKGQAKARLNRTAEAKQDYQIALRLAVQADDMETKARAEKELRMLE